MAIQRSRGFTIIELIAVITFFGFASVLFFIQKNNLEIIAKDNLKKTAINAMYYSLEEVFYAKNGYYPRTIGSDNLKSMDPDLFTDPDGIQINTVGSAYIYSPTDCNGDKCNSYTLKTTLDNEADFTKTSRND